MISGVDLGGDLSDLRCKHFFVLIWSHFFGAEFGDIHILHDVKRCENHAIERPATT